MSLATPGTLIPTLPPGKLDLKYLFCAQLEDGTIIEQTEEDVSKFTPGRNAFYDLLIHDINGDPVINPIDNKICCRPDIKLFQLEDGVHNYLVDLTDGHFEIQHGRKQLIGAPFFLAFPPIGSKLSLFYFKRRRHHSNVTGVVQEDKSISISNTEEISQECEYHFGWETEDKLVKAEMMLV